MRIDALVDGQKVAIDWQTMAIIPQTDMIFDERGWLSYGPDPDRMAVAPAPEDELEKAKRLLEIIRATPQTPLTVGDLSVVSARKDYRNLDELFEAFPRAQISPELADRLCPVPNQTLSQLIASNLMEKGLRHVKEIARIKQLMEERESGREA